MGSRFKIAIAKICLALTAFFLPLVGVEFYFRLFDPQPTYSSLLDLLPDQYIAADFIPFTLKSSYEARVPSMEYPGTYVGVRINSLGLRGPEISAQKPEGTRRVLILGDSYTFGVYVADEEVYPRVLERLLRDAGSQVEVLNAGYADGWSPDEHYAWLKRKGLEFSPDLIIYGMFIGNDVPPDGSAREGWRDLDEHGLPTRVVNPKIYIDELGRLRSLTRDNRTVGVERVYRFPWLRESHAIVRLGRSLENRMRRRAEPGLAHYGAEIGSLAFLFEPQLSKEMLEGEQLFLELVSGMSRTAANRGCAFMVMLIPINYQVDESLLRQWDPAGNVNLHRDYFSRLRGFLDSRNVTYLDLLEAMRARPGSYYPRNGEVHFNPNGHRFAAETLADFIAHHELLADAARHSGR